MQLCGTERNFSVMCEENGSPLIGTPSIIFVD